MVELARSKAAFDTDHGVTRSASWRLHGYFLVAKTQFSNQDSIIMQCEGISGMCLQRPFHLHNLMLILNIPQREHRYGIYGIYGM